MRGALAGIGCGLIHADGLGTLRILRWEFEVGDCFLQLPESLPWLYARVRMNNGRTKRQDNRKGCTP